VTSTCVAPGDAAHKDLPRPADGPGDGGDGPAIADGRIDGGQPDSAKPDGVAADTQLNDLKADAPKPDAPKPDALKPDAPMPDAPKPDAPKPVGPSCAGLAASCGAGGNKSCCAASLVTGGTFKRSYDAVSYTNASYPATVSDFVLDDYEVTVGRFRKFVAAYPSSKPAANSGKNPNNPADPGWDSGWNSSLPVSQATLTLGLKCDSSQTWTDAPGANESLPLNCVSWFEAFAFCVWDNGRMPTEAEWNYAAAGGGGSDGQRVYPWSSPSISTTISAAYAVYSSGAPQKVGSKSPQGDGKWGQADLAGNLSEWMLDSFVDPYPNPCTDCANLTLGGGRMIRGGAFSAPASGQLVALRTDHKYPNTRSSGTGIRCVRSP